MLYLYQTSFLIIYFDKFKLIYLLLIKFRSLNWWATLELAHSFDQDSLFPAWTNKSSLRKLP